MNKHEKWEKLLAGYALGELGEQQADEVRMHLDQCQECSRQLQRFQRVVACTDNIAELSADENSCKSARQSVMAAVTSSQENKNQTACHKSGQAYTWRIIMKSRITKFVTAAVIIIAVLIGINEFGGSSIAFGDILENIKKAKTLAWKTTLVTEGQNPRITRTMVLEPYYMRVELEDGTVWILDRSQGKTLILDPSRKIAVISSTAKTSPDILEIYNTFENFKNMEGFLVEEVGQQQIDGKSSIGFRLTKEDESQQIMVWADIETELPILIETTITDTQSSHVFQSITSDIVFGVELDEVLFNIEPPEGYKKQSIFVPANPTPEFRRAQSATNIYRILKICLDYVEENGGEWPNSLYDLVNYGLPKETLVNPRQPKRENGYVYLKPEERLSPSDDIILYEAYDGWGGGINVGFADGHIDFIKEESDFNKRLLK